MAIMAGLPGSLVALIMLWSRRSHSPGQNAVDSHRPDRRALVGFAFAVRDRVVFPLQTLSNLLAALARGRLLRARPRRAP